jgi:hypothetical protein
VSWRLISKRLTREARLVRRDLVHLAGCHLRRAASPCAYALIDDADWRSSLFVVRTVSVPRSLRSRFGRRLEAPRG